MDKRRVGDRSRQSMLSLFLCAGARPGREVYLSTPITTGELFVQWRRTTRHYLADAHPDYPALHREHVVDPNLERVRPVVEELRGHYAGRLVIDPTALDDIDGWEQSDYREFWCAVVARYAGEVVFADGWHFSTGCAAEFATAMAAGIRMCRQDLTPLSAEEGFRLVTDAAAELERLGEDARGLRHWLGQATRAAGGTGASR